MASSPSSPSTTGWKAVRLPLRKLTEKVLPSLVVLSHNEVDGPIKTLKVVGLEG
jgi:hypothetical protein